MARYNVAFANESLSDEYDFSRAPIGWIITFSTLLYGLSAIFNGPIADKIGGRRAMLPLWNARPRRSAAHQEP